MRKIFTLALVFLSIATFAQTPFIIPVTYRGAFAPSPATMWTTGWTNWNPQNANYGTSVDSVIATPITTNTVLSGTKKYLLRGLIYVKNDASLTINAGCILKGDATVANSSLVITRGAKIRALGSSTKPVVFTSSNPAGSRAKGDWGGLILLGKAHYNGAGGTAFIEGIAPTPDTQYGGGTNYDDNDSSGVLQYVRIEYGGYIFAPNQEINGLTFGAVGRKTVVNYVQVSFANDDAFEWFGGAVNCRYLVSYRNLDDNWDTDNGFSGAVQFCLGVRDPQIADNPSVSTSEGFESDNDAGGTNSKPYTSAVFSNITEIGPLRGSITNPVAPGFRRGVRIRRNSHLRILNSIIMDHPTGVFIDGAACTALATGNYLSSIPNNNPGNLVFKNNIVSGNRIGAVVERNTVWPANVWFGLNRNDSIVGTTDSSAGKSILINPYDFTSPDYRPVAGSLATRNFNFNDSAFLDIDSAGNTSPRIACPAIAPTPGAIIGRSNACSYILSGDTAKYYLVAKSGSVLRYNWTVPTGASILFGQGTDTIIVNFSNAYATGNISVTAQTYCGALGATRLFAVNKGVPAAPGLISGPSFVCSFLNGDTATYSVLAVTFAASYNWTVPAGATIVAGQGTNVIKVLYSNTFNSGTVTVSASSPCGTSVARALAVTRLSAAPGLIAGPTSICTRVNTPVVYSVRRVLNATGYVWSVPANATIVGPSNDTSITVVYSSATAAVGYVRVRSVTACSQSADRALAVYGVAPVIRIDGSTSVCPNDVVTYTAFDTLNGAGTTYTWTVPAGITIVSGQGTASLTVSVSPTFLTGNITCRPNNCNIAGGTKALAVNLNLGCRTKNVFAKNGTVSTEDVLGVYPNPSKGNFAVRMSTKANADKGSLQIMNAYGQVVAQRSIRVNGGIINENVADGKLAPGMYILKITVGTETKTSKIIVE